MNSNEPNQKTVENNNESPETEQLPTITEAARQCQEEAKNPTAANKPKVSKRTKSIIIGAAAVVVIAAGATAFALNQPAPTQEESQPNDQQTQIVDDQSRPKKIDASIKVNVPASEQAEGMTPFIAHVKGESDAVKKVDFYTALDKHSDDGVSNSHQFKIIDGERYSVTYIDSITTQGSIIHVDAKPQANNDDQHGNTSEVDQNLISPNPDTNGVLANAFKADGSIEQSYTIVKPENVTQEQIDQIMAQLKDAVAKGDETLAGDKGQAIIDAAAANAKANPNVDSDKVNADADDAKQNVSDTPVNTDQQSNTNCDTNNDQTSSGGSSGSGGSTPDPTPDPSPNPDPSPQPDPEPQKHWVDEVGHYEPVYEQQWISNWVTIVDVPEHEAWKFSDGHIAYTIEEYKAYAKATGLSYHSITIPAQTHQEDRGHYEQVQTGQNWVVDVPGHWE